MFEKRISIFTGHYGSGKTETAVNYAIKASEAGHQVAIVDFDIVNPFFRTADVKEVLEEKGLRVITPVYANTNIDVPALPPDVSSVFEKKAYKVVLDVGGDDLGAKVLSRYRDELLGDDFEFFFVINPRRPETDTLEKIKEMVALIEESARMKVTRLVNNTNLLSATTAKHVEEGQALIESVSRDLGIPIGFVSGLPGVLDRLELDRTLERLPLAKLIKLPWD